MATQTLHKGLIGIKLHFTGIVLLLAFFITFGSFVLAEQLSFTIRSQFMELTAARYRLEYTARAYNTSMLAAVGDLFSGSVATSFASSSHAVSIPVLTYHSVLPGKEDGTSERISSFEGQNISLAQFKEQMFALKQAGWHTVTLKEFEAFMRGEKNLPEKSFLLTFDDGAKNSFYPVDPLLSALDYNAVAFILPAHSLGDRSTYYLNKNEVHRVLNTGRWEIQSHGDAIHVARPITSDGSVQENALSNRLWLQEQNRLETHEEYASRIEADLHSAKVKLEEEFGVPITSFAFPFGDYGQNRSNDPLAEETIRAAAKKEYSLVFYQNWNEGDFLFNSPAADAFMIKRIPVDPTWDGGTLLSLMSNHAPKSLPYEDTFTANNGWQSEWGDMVVGTGGLRLAAQGTTTGALALLDGTAAWRDYQVEMDVEWSHGYVMVLFDMKSARTGRACVYSADGWVQLQNRTEDDIFILRESKHDIVSAGAHTIGAITRGTTSACLFDGERVIDAELPETYGGIGAAVWAPEEQVAEVFIKKASVDKLE